MKKIRNQVIKFRTAASMKVLQAKYKLTENTGEGYVDTAVKILLCVVLGALLLAGLYALFNDTVLPTLTRRIQEMFNYAGYSGSPAGGGHGGIFPGTDSGTGRIISPSAVGGVLL